MKKRTIVFVRSVMSGRVAIINPTSALMGVGQPTVEGLDKDVEFKQLEFDGSDQVIDGVKRKFWVAEITQADFRWLLSHKKSSNWEGSGSFSRIYQNGPAKDLIQKAYDYLPQIEVETRNLTQKQTAA